MDDPIQCPRCDRFFSADWGWKHVHPYILSQIKVRNIAVERKECPECARSARFAAVLGAAASGPSSLIESLRRRQLAASRSRFAASVSAN